MLKLWLEMVSEFPVSFILCFSVFGKLTGPHKGKKSSGRLTQHFVIKFILTSGNVSVALFSMTKINGVPSFSHDTQVPESHSVVETDVQINQEKEYGQKANLKNLWFLLVLNSFLFLLTWMPCFSSEPELTHLFMVLGLHFFSLSLLTHTVAHSSALKSNPQRFLVD